jgi:hypothetical protein
MSAPEEPRNKPIAELVEPVGMPLELRCGPCGRKGKYGVGRICIDPDKAREEGPGFMDRAFSCTGYFHCKHCGAGGPWHLTPTSQMMLMGLMLQAIHSPDEARIFLGKPVLFDGTQTQCGTQSVAHLEQLIEKDPGNYYLWSRLGNTFVAAELPDRALEAFREAIRLEEHDVESLHSVAQVLREQKQKEEAARYFHQTLLHARQAPARTPRPLLRELIRDTMDQLMALHHESHRRIPLFPPVPLPPGLDLARKEERERLVEWWITGKLPVAPRSSQLSSWTARPSRPASSHVGRNDPCPCGSGKKFKNCCMRG